MAQFENLLDAVHHYGPAGSPNAVFVDHGQILDVGNLPVEEHGDCYLIGEGDDVRALPKARWRRKDNRLRPAKPDGE